MAELPRKGVRRDARCARGSKDPERRRGGTRASRGRRDGSNRRRMGGKAPLQEPEGVRSALLDSTRTFTKPMSLAYSRKHCLQMFRLYLRMIPHWFAHTRLLEGRGGEGQDRSLGRVGSGRNVETLENGARHAAPRATGSGPRSRPTTRGRLVHVTHAPIVRRSRRELAPLPDALLAVHQAVPVTHQLDRRHRFGRPHLLARGRGASARVCEGRAARPWSVASSSPVYLVMRAKTRRRRGRDL